MTIFTTTLSSPLGTLWLGDYQNSLCFIQFTLEGELYTHLNRLVKKLNTTLCEKETPLLLEAKRQLTAYFNKESKTFSLPLFLAGTDFQKRVWQALMTIPYGETCSYQDIARKVGNINAVRAVGGANNANLLPIVIPCHRVVQKNGGLGGYDCGTSLKQFLLDLERSA